ncbi:iron complex transport system permease protein [Noviherbaspirillum humi]|uniref:Iron complex transport system permease protein n=2 Tax=Noviherbaspirillum humi TaxID=1688639 RepID=A0A239GQ63_9BURK|nr:iron ABC transporter permease [Noviherbaspirillum humi]SNS71277.1 iron complex transport system permease protein [Noviherbaspirillum humi]
MLCGLALAAALSLLAACLAGSVAIDPADMLALIGRASPDEAHSLAASLLALRLERALSAFATGAMLALAGTLMQALLRNPLADPYVLGLSGGAAVGALLAMLLGAAAWLIDVSAFAGAMLVAGLIFLFAWRDLRAGLSEANGPLLLLTGVILAAGCGALVTLMLSLAPEGRLRGMVFWLVGDLSATPLRLFPWAVLGAALVFGLRAARDINLMALHAEGAVALGVPVGRLRQRIFACAALLTAAAVSNAGSIGFVGLLVPHACRFALGPDHRLLLPAATLSGGAFLVLADTLARTAVAPQQLPVGVVTALIGVPVFLLQLHQARRR